MHRCGRQRSTSTLSVPVPSSSSVAFATSMAWEMSSNGGASFATVCNCTNVLAACPACTDPYRLLSWNPGGNPSTLSNVPVFYAGFLFRVTLSNACGAIRATLTAPSPPAATLCTLPQPSFLSSSGARGAVGATLNVTVTLRATSVVPAVTWLFSSNQSAVPLNTGLYAASLEGVGTSNAPVATLTVS